MMKKPATRRMTFADREAQRALLDDLKAAMIDSVQGAAPGAKPISLWDQMRAALRDFNASQSRKP